MNQYLNMTPIIYPDLNMAYIYPELKTDSAKQDFYNKHGYADELILLPKRKTNNKAIAIMIHYDADNIVKDYVIQNIKCLIHTGYDILFCTTSESIQNVDLPINIVYFKNKGPGCEWIYLCNILKNKKDLFKSNYEWIFFINDSVLLPIHGPEKFLETVNNMRMKSDFWAHWESNENNHHGIDCPQEFKIKAIDDIISFLDHVSTNDTNKSKENIKLVPHLITKGYNFSAVIPIISIDIKPEYVCPIFHPNVFPQWINRKETFAIKWKYMMNYIDLIKINNPILNYLTRYIHFGENGVQGEPQKQSAYAHPSVYRGK